MRDPRGRRRLRLGMVGGGQGALIGAIHRLACGMDGRYELVAGCFASTPERSRASAEAIAVSAERVYGSFAEMAERERCRHDGIDVVAIVTPNNLHFPVAKTFLAAGINVLCDKPMTTSVAEARELAAQVERSGLVFVLTHNYPSYPMVRTARALVADGRLGALRMVQVEYPQDWLSTPLEGTGQKQALWRTDPERSGPGGAVADIGTHAINLATFVTGLRLEAVAADVHTFVDGRRLDDNVHVLLRFGSGVRGMLWASQVAPGITNGIRLRVFGDAAGLEWAQEDADRLRLSPLGQALQILERGRVAGPVADRRSRVPPGCPEGFIEGFANLYDDAAELIWASIEGRAPDPDAALLPTVHDGLEGMKFVEAVIASGRNDSSWAGLDR